MTKIIRTLALVLAVFLPMFGMAMDKETKTEDDGFSWVLVSDNGFRGAESVSGKTLIPLSAKFNWVSYDGGFLCGTDVDKTEYNEKGQVTKNYQGYYTKDGKCVVPPDLYDTVFLQEAENGAPAYFRISKGGKHGACDINGNLVLEPISYSIVRYEDAGFRIQDENGNYVNTGIVLPGHDPIAMADKKEKKESDGFVWTQLRTDDWKYGAMDSKRNMILPIIFDKVTYKPSKTVGSTGIFIGSIDDAEGWYAANGFAFVPVEEGYTYIRPANYENYTMVENGELKYGVYEPTLGEVIPCGKYDYVSYDNSGYFRVEKDDKYGAVDIYGNEIVPPLYPYLSRDEKGLSYTNDDLEDVYVYTAVFPETQERVSARFDKALNSTDCDEAIDLYRNVILADPMGRFGYVSYCYNNMGVMYGKKGDKATAKLYYQKAVELDPNNDVARKNLEIVDAPQSQPQEKRSGWDILAGVLEAFGNAANTYNAYASSQSYTQYDNASGQSSNNQASKSKATKPKGNAFAKSVNKRISNDTYNNYVTLLINMSVWPSRYDDTQRRSIQSSMKSMREKNGLHKSPWEDWDGNPKNAPR